MPEAEAERLLGWEDYQAQPEDGNRHEIVDGQWVVMPPPRLKHQEVAGELHGLLWTFLQGSTDFRVYMAPCAVQLGEHSFVEPDIFVVPLDGSVELQELRVVGPPLLVIEVLSPSTMRHDLLRKRRLYQRVAVREYWIVDPEGESITVYDRQGSDLLPRAALLADCGGEVTSGVLEGFAVEVTRVFG